MIETKTREDALRNCELLWRTIVEMETTDKGEAVERIGLDTDHNCPYCDWAEEEKERLNAISRRDNGVDHVLVNRCELCPSKEFRDMRDGTDGYYPCIYNNKSPYHRWGSTVHHTSQSAKDMHALTLRELERNGLEPIDEY